MHVLDIQLMLAVHEVKRMHFEAAFDLGFLPKFDVHVIDAEMLNRSLEMAFKLESVRHLVHHGSEIAYVGKHDIGGMKLCVKLNGIHEMLEGRITIVVHVEVEMEQAVVGFHLHVFQEDTFLTNGYVRLEVLQVKATLFGGLQFFHHNENRVADHREMLGFEVDAVEVKMGIVDALVGSLR